MKINSILAKIVKNDDEIEEILQNGSFNMYPEV